VKEKCELNSRVARTARVTAARMIVAKWVSQ
jgi:hypothetical protein